MHTTRRRFLAAAGSLATAAALPVRLRGTPGVTQASADAREIDQLFDRSIVIDALSADDAWSKEGEVLDAFKRSGLTAIQTSLNNRNLQAALRDLADWQARFDRRPDRLLKVLRGADIHEAKKTGRLGVMLGFQNATMIETDLKNLDQLHQLGTRCIQLTYNSRNLLGDGCTERTNAGLSDFGIAVVERMNDLRIVVDLSHCGEQTSKDGIAFSKRPAAFTHTMCKAVHDHVRAKSDELLKAAAAKGGMVGIATLGYFVGPSPETSVDDYIRHIDHAVKVAGVDHVGIASDYAIRGIAETHTRETWYVPRLSSFPPAYRVRWPPWIKELDPPERFRTIAQALARKGYPSGDIEKILGGNWTRYFTEVLG